MVSECWLLIRFQCKKKRLITKQNTRIQHNWHTNLISKSKLVAYKLITKHVLKQAQREKKRAIASEHKSNRSTPFYPSQTDKRRKWAEETMRRETVSRTLLYNTHWYNAAFHYTRSTSLSVSIHDTTLDSKCYISQ